MTDAIKQPLLPSPMRLYVASHAQTLTYFTEAQLLAYGQSCAEAATAAERERAPAWHDAPTVPGLWMNKINLLSYWVETFHILNGSFRNSGACWYGPIPEDTK